MPKGGICAATEIAKHRGGLESDCQWYPCVQVNDILLPSHHHHDMYDSQILTTVNVVIADIVVVGVVIIVTAIIVVDVFLL